MLRGLYHAINVHLEHPAQEKQLRKGEKRWLCEQAGAEPVAINPNRLLSLGTPWFALTK